MVLYYFNNCWDLKWALIWKKKVKTSNSNTLVPTHLFQMGINITFFSVLRFYHCWDLDEKEYFLDEGKYFIKFNKFKILFKNLLIFSLQISNRRRWLNLTISQLDRCNTSAQTNHMNSFKSKSKLAIYIYFGEKVRIKSLSLSGRDPAYIPVWQKAMVI